MCVWGGSQVCVFYEAFVLTPLFPSTADESVYERSLEVYEKYTDCWEVEQEQGQGQEQE